MGLFSHHVYLLLDKGIDSSSSSRNEYKELKRRTSYTIKHGKIVKKLVNKTITSSKAEKKFFPGKSVHTPTPLSLNSKISGNIL